LRVPSEITIPCGASLVLSSRTSVMAAPLQVATRRSATVSQGCVVLRRRSGAGFGARWERPTGVRENGSRNPAGRRPGPSIWKGGAGRRPERRSTRACSVPASFFDQDVVGRRLAIRPAQQES
jgi:hypothetical protein